MTIWKVHRILIVVATIWSSAFGLEMLRVADGDTTKLVLGSMSVIGSAGLLIYFRWFQQKTGKRSAPRGRRS